MSAAVTYWCDHAWLGGDAVEPGVVLEVEGDRIASVSPAPSPPWGAIWLRGLTMPGFANAHSHAFHRALRGRTHVDGGTFWTWRDQMYALAAGLTPDTYLALATATFAEMVTAGYTCVGEFHYLHHGPGGVPYRNRNEMSEVLVAAAAAAGIRLTLLDTCYLTAGFGAPAVGVQLRFSDGSADGWAERASAVPDGPTVRGGAAIHSVRAVPVGAMATIDAWARSRNAPLHAHVSEQPAENAACLAATGVTPTRLLAEHVSFKHRFTAVHAIHLADIDAALLRGSGCWCCVCPTTERDLGDGISELSAATGPGVTLALGSDSHAVIDPFEEAKALELDARLLTMRRGVHAPASLAAAATRHGYDALGWRSGGSLTAGSLADFVTVSLDGVRLAGASADGVLAAVLFGATAADVRDVVIAGRRVVQGGKHVAIDVARQLTESIDAAWTVAVPT